MGFNLTPYRLITFGTNDNLSHELVSSLSKNAKKAKFFEKCSRCVAFCCERSFFIAGCASIKTLAVKVSALTHFSLTTDKGGRII